MRLKTCLFILGIAAVAMLQLQCTTPTAIAEGPCEAGPAGDKPAQLAKTSDTNKPPKRIWAQSYLFTDAPKLEVGEWISAKPGNMKGKFIIVEFWRTWCSACKRTAPLMNLIHEKYSKDFVVIGITGEDKEKVVAGWDGPKVKYHIALDKPGPDTTKPEQGAYEAKFGVFGWPHVVILEPRYRAVIWEGFTGLKGYELTEEKIKKMIAIKNGKK